MASLIPPIIAVQNGLFIVVGTYAIVISDTTLSDFASADAALSAPDDVSSFSEDTSAVFVGSPLPASVPELPHPAKFAAIATAIIMLSTPFFFISSSPF